MKAGGKETARDKDAPDATDPVDVVDGIADRTHNPRAWKYILLGAVFVLWLAFLIISAIVGSPPRQ